MQKQTTGATVSRLGVLTVLANNQLTANEVSDEDKVALRAQIKRILKGDAGVPAEKIQIRSVERCLNGGAVILVGEVGIYGTN